MSAWLARLWYWFSQLAGGAVIALAIAFGIVETFSTEGAVWRFDNVEVEGKPLAEREGPVRVPRGGWLVYTADVVAIDSCPGEAVYTWFMKPPKPPTLIVTRRAVQLPGVNKPDQTFRHQVPENAASGPWTYTHTLQSRCPLRSQVDTVVTIEVEVY